MKRRSALAVAGQVTLDALSGRLGVPMMVLGYAVFALLLLAYVSIQVYSNSLMETVAARKRDEIALQERMGILTAEYATMTSKSRVSQYCEDDLGLVTARMSDVIRVAVDARSMEDAIGHPVVRIGEAMTGDVDGLTQVMNR